MADGDANIKVVVRCRPLNARGILSLQFLLLLSSHSQNSQEAQRASFACTTTRPFSTLQTPMMLNALQREKQCPLALTRAIGVLVQETTLSTVHNRPSTTTSAKISSTTALLALTPAFSLVSPSFIPSSILTLSLSLRWSNRSALAPIFPITKLIIPGSGKSYRCPLPSSSSTHAHLSFSMMGCTHPPPLATHTHSLTHPI